jgi:hyaluronan synthase
MMNDATTQSKTLGWTILATLIAMLLLSAYSLNAKHPLYLFAQVPVLNGRHNLLIHASMIWTFAGLLLLLLRTLLWFRYRPSTAATLENAPYMTVVIPAYNEGAMVAKSIDSVACARYPAERLEIFVIDDGSRDDTWEHILRAAERYPGLVTVARFAKNRGKRAALAEGFRKAKGEIVVTIDSDNVIDAGTLLAIAGPFRNPRVGAVAGKVRVYNRGEGLIPKMLHVRFMLSFDFLRAAQSTYGAVHCCPGALAAYRTVAVRHVLGRWMNQTFLGKRCTIGEDRAMTNYLLAEGYDAVYQRTAVVNTVVPVTYRKTCKMFLRWDRSYIREELRLAAIALRRPPLAMLITLTEVAVIDIGYLLGYATLALLLCLCAEDHHVSLYILAAIGLAAAINTLYYLRMEGSRDFIYGILYAYFSFFTLFWILPYAAVTARSGSWMTR